MSGRYREDLPDIWEWSRDRPEFPVVVSWPFRMSGSGRENLLDAQEALSNVWEALSDVQEWS